VKAYVLVRVDARRAADIIGKMREVKGVSRVDPVLGRYDVVVRIEAKGFGEVAEAAKKINSIQGVKFTETLVEA